MRFLKTFLAFVTVIFLPSPAFAPPSATLTVQVVTSGACGVSPDPQAAVDGFTSPALCVDFTQQTVVAYIGGSPIPSANWLRCPSDGTPGYALYAGYNHGTFDGCQNVTHEIDPLTGQYALHIAAPDSFGQTSGIQIFTADGENPGATGNHFGQGWFQMTTRSSTTPSPGTGALNNNVAGNNATWYGGFNTNQEVDQYENWYIFGDCADMGVLDHSNVTFYSYSFLPGIVQTGCGGSPRLDNSQYQTYAIRITGNGTNVGYTAYVNGSVVGGVTTGYSGNVRTGVNGAYEIWNNSHGCVFGGGLLCNGDTINITNAFQCNGVTCLTLSAGVTVTTGGPPNIDCSPTSVSGAGYAYITGASGIAGLNGVHLGVCPTDHASPSVNLALPDLPWPGGTYGGGGRWNPMTQADIWVKNIMFFACPGFDPTLPNPNTSNYCDMPNGHAVLSGAP